MRYKILIITLLFYNKILFCDLAIFWIEGNSYYNTSLNFNENITSLPIIFSNYTINTSNIAYSANNGYIKFNVSKYYKISFFLNYQFSTANIYPSVGIFNITLNILSSSLFPLINGQTTVGSTIIDVISGQSFQLQVFLNSTVSSTLSLFQSFNITPVMLIIEDL